MVQFVGIAIAIGLFIATLLHERETERDAFGHRVDQFITTFDLQMVRALLAIGESGHTDNARKAQDFCGLTQLIEREHPYVIAVLRHSHEPKHSPDAIRRLECDPAVPFEAKTHTTTIWINSVAPLAPRIATLSKRLETQLYHVASTRTGPGIAAFEMPGPRLTGHLLAIFHPHGDGREMAYPGLTSAVVDPVALMTELRNRTAVSKRLAVSFVSSPHSLPQAEPISIPPIWCLLSCNTYSTRRTVSWGGAHWTIAISEAAPPLLVRYRGSATVALLGLILSALWFLHVRRAQSASWHVSNMIEQREKEMQSLNEILIEDIERRKRITDELTRSRAQLRQLTDHNARVKEEERKRIAREIHDDLGQSMMVLRIDLSLIAKAEINPTTQVRIQHALSQIDQTVTAMRLIINELRPAVLDLGLDAAIEWESQKFSRRSGIACTIDMRIAGVDLEDELTTAFYRIAQESLTNIMRHSQASSTTIHLWIEREWLFMKIADDGIGLHEKDRANGESFGLIGIAERIFALGGAFNIESAPGHGTTMLIAAPLAKVSSHEQQA